jgi:hypothetical protein
MPGKEIFRVIANQCFEVKDTSNIMLTGKEQNKQVVRQLAKLPLSQQPTDFQELVALLKKRVNGF